MREGVVANMLHCYASICFPVPPPLIPLHSLSAPSPLSLHTSLISFSSQCLLCGCGTFSTLTIMAFSYEISKLFDFLFAHTTKTTTNLNEMLLHAFTHCTCHHKQRPTNVQTAADVQTQNKHPNVCILSQWFPNFGDHRIKILGVITR